MSYKICKITGCDNHIPAESEYKYCLYHRHLIDRPCAYYFHKKMLVASVEWCNKHDKRYDDLPCQFCPDWRDPLEELEWAAKLVEKIRRIKL